ncbi:hypothetical protein ACI6Q2_19315 [Chitinophagaceae bacterium LWZ2-11]
MIFGTVFTGQIKSQEKQYIETKVFCVIIPVSVETTMLVTEVTANGRRGIEIKTNPTSIIAAAIRPIITVLFLFSFAAYLGNSDTMQWLLLPTLIGAVLFVYSWFFFGKTTKYEKFVREQFGKQFGLYFMPEWLNPNEQFIYFDNLKTFYVKNFGTTDWKEKVKTTPYYSEEFSIFYCLTALENTLNYNSGTDKMLKEIATQGL